MISNANTIVLRLDEDEVPADTGADGAAAETIMGVLLIVFYTRTFFDIQIRRSGRGRNGRRGLFDILFPFHTPNDQ